MGSKPTEPPIETDKPTQAPTEKPTQAPTEEPSQAPATTVKPTKKRKRKGKRKGNKSKRAVSLADTQVGWVEVGEADMPQMRDASSSTRVSNDLVLKVRRGGVAPKEVALSDSLIKIKEGELITGRPLEVKAVRDFIDDGDRDMKIVFDPIRNSPLFFRDYQPSPIPVSIILFYFNTLK